MRPNGYFCFVAFRKESIQLKNLIVESCLRRIILRLFIPEMFSLLAEFNLQMQQNSD